MIDVHKRYSWNEKFNEYALIQLASLYETNPGFSDDDFLMLVDKLLGYSFITFIPCYHIFFKMLAVVEVYD